MDALAKLGLSPRIVSVEIEGFGTVRLRYLTLEELEQCSRDKDTDEQARLLLAKSLVDEQGNRLFDDDFNLKELPPALIKSIAEHISRISGFSEDAAKN